ncbi:hypothetical protein VTJ04DRAFT_4700 [Mycothermus thermophilus]|uniref:uncharacterized protein n=1 Tax=Humicola insolens TaxID=85995 RepID=UPI0037429B4C
MPRPLNFPTAGQPGSATGLGRWSQFHQLVSNTKRTHQPEADAFEYARTTYELWPDQAMSPVIVSRKTVQTTLTIQTIYSV